MEFNEQFNVLDVAKNQPTVERIVFETVKAMERFRVGSTLVEHHSWMLTFPFDRRERQNLFRLTHWTNLSSSK